MNRIIDNEYAIAHGLIYETKQKSLLKAKLIILAVFIVFTLSGFFLVRHYFYMLDSYAYTAEFHYLFMLNNLKNSDLGLFVDYFKSLGNVTSVFYMLLFGSFIQAFIAPFTSPVLTFAVSSTVGSLKGFFLSYASLLIVGISAFWIGTFFLGDIVPFLKKRYPTFSEQLSNSIFTYCTITFIMSIPFVSIAFPTVLGALIRIRFTGILYMLIIAIFFRLLSRLVSIDPASFNL